MQYNQSADFAKFLTFDIQKIKKVPRPHGINKMGVATHATVAQVMWQWTPTIRSLMEVFKLYHRSQVS